MSALFLTIAIAALSGCTNHLDPNWGSEACTPGEEIDSADCNEACEPGATYTVCSESGTPTCRLRPGHECSNVPPAPCNGAQVGDACEICSVPGVTACVGGNVRCVPDYAPHEVCGNGTDDDCNGMVDDGCGDCTDDDVRSCGVSNTGACQLGTQTCSGGSWGDCIDAVNPSPEVCDGRDNNCDGVIDEGCACTNGETQSCGSDVGACVSGTSVCSGGVWGPCSGGITPVAETCNGIDDNCNGVVDDGNVCGECTPGESQGCTASCGTWGIQTCSSSRHWNTCQPPAETCNGIDDNCNGVVDETCACVHGATRPCGTSVGACVSGVETCTAGSWGSCVGGVSPRPETCNGIDDDCNGVVDDGVLNACGACGAVPAETCDGIDNDCDGTVDEGCTCINGQTQSCGTDVGACVSGTATCYSGSWGSCVGSIGPRTETCNGIDDDCDGVTDEGGVCAPVCTVTNGGVEACDGVDNDCDGLVDEGALGEFVGTEFCVGYGSHVPPLLTYDGTPVTHANVVIFDCSGIMRSFTISASSPYACIPLNSSCSGWVATTYFQGSSADVNDLGSFYSTASANYRGRSASSMDIRVFGRTPGQPDRDLSNLSWVEYDPTGATVPSGGTGSGTLHVGERILRGMGPVRGACASEGQYPPDRY